MLWQWIIRIALWTLAGYLGSRIMKDGTPNGWLGNVILGWIVGLIGNFAFRLVGLVLVREPERLLVLRPAAVVAHPGSMQRRNLKS